MFHLRKEGAQGNYDVCLYIWGQWNLSMCCKELNNLLYDSTIKCFFILKLQSYYTLSIQCVEE